MTSSRELLTEPSKDPRHPGDSTDEQPGECKGACDAPNSDNKCFDLCDLESAVMRGPVR